MTDIKSTDSIQVAKSLLTSTISNWGFEGTNRKEGLDEIAYITKQFLAYCDIRGR